MKARPTKHAGEMVLELNRRDEPLMAAASVETKTSPFRLKKILVPIDFSDCAKKALQYAIPLAKEHEAAITLLYVVPINYAVGEYGGIDYASLETEMRAEGDRQLEKLCVDEVGGEVPADTLLRTGSPTSEIIEVAKSLGADLIVISTHGRTGLKHVLLGSVAEHVVRHAPCPPGELSGPWVPHYQPKRPTEKQDKQLACDSLKKLHSLIPSQAEALGIITDCEVIEGRDAGQAISQEAERFGADLICLGSHGRSGLSKALLGSVAQAVIGQSKRPVLVIRPKR